MPVKIPGVEGIVDIKTRNGLVIAVDNTGQVYIWGFPIEGSENYISKPTKVDLLFDIVEIACGGDHYAVIDKYGDVWTWGDNFESQLARRTSSDFSNSPAKVPGVKIQVDKGIRLFFENVLQFEPDHYLLYDEIDPLKIHKFLFVVWYSKSLIFTGQMSSTAQKS